MNVDVGHGEGWWTIEMIDADHPKWQPVHWHAPVHLFRFTLTADEARSYRLEDAIRLVRNDYYRYIKYRSTLKIRFVSNEDGDIIPFEALGL